MVERAITHVIIDSNPYIGDESIEFEVIQEQYVETEFWWHYKQI